MKKSEYVFVGWCVFRGACPYIWTAQNTRRDAKKEYETNTMRLMGDWEHIEKVYIRRESKEKSK